LTQFENNTFDQRTSLSFPGMQTEEEKEELHYISARVQKSKVANAAKEIKSPQSLRRKPLFNQMFKRSTSVEFAHTRSKEMIDHL
jgi:hypothetical protein